MKTLEKNDKTSHDDKQSVPTQIIYLKREVTYRIIHFNWK